MFNQDEQQKIERLRQIVYGSRRIVFFGGAGVSTESGIPDFRSVDGLYNQRYAFPPETILSADFFHSNTEEFFRFYKDKMLYLDAEPNFAHIFLAKLEKQGILDCVVTQNIDGLHQKAGSKRVYELHGSVLRNYCVKCGKFFSAEYVKESKGVPRCDSCGSVVKPDVVLYQEGLDDITVSMSLRAISRADTLIVGGTSLSVMPASGLINYFNGDNLVLINKQNVSAAVTPTLSVFLPIAQVFHEVDAKSN